jgi:cellulose synthase/poly-beta-1,6-N-acetylglucosamine synthase-like glycosyltransferase
VIGDLTGTALLATIVLAVAVMCIRPLRQRRGDDRGDGWGTVDLPKPRSVSMARVLSFYLCSSAITLAVIAPHPGPISLYQGAVARLATLAYDNPSAVAAYASHVSAPLRLVVIANLFAFSLVLRAPMGRRIAVAAHSALFLVIVIVLDALGCASAAAMHLPSETASLFGSLLIFLVAIAVVLRLVATTFKVPQPTAVPDLRVHHRSESLLLGVATIVAVVLVFAMVDLADTTFGIYHPTAFLVVFIGFPLVFDVLLLFLLLSTRSIRPPRFEGEPPPITTITPAFNEESTIARTLRSIDDAAGAYGGRVRVVLVDDGSHDRTVEVASSVMAGFRHAEGCLVSADHGGKAAALNKGLWIASTDIVVRVDADVVIDRRAFVHLPDWFANPSVGMVGALALPDPRADSWFARGRLFECLIGFGFARVALQRVDAVNCIPGTFTAFRGSPARFVGGFVSGMNGEDSDLTMLLGRLGYHVAIDTRIRIYEDVPGTLREFREQRVRWNRAGVHILSRHSPALAGGGSPRSWFFYLRAATVRVTAVLRPLVFVTGLELALVNPATRSTAPRVLVFYFVAAFPTLVAIVVLAVRFGYARKLGWLPIWFAFTLVRRIVALEGLLTLPVRPVPRTLDELVPAPARPLRVFRPLRPLSPSLR